MQRLSRQAAERLMSLYAPEELEAFDRMFDPGRYRATEAPVVPHHQMLEQRRLRSLAWHQEDEMERQLQEAERTPEAVCRGYSGPAQPGDEDVPPGPAKAPLVPGDEMVATRAWVRYHFAPMAGFKGIERSAVLKDRLPREVWRAAAGALLAMPRDRLSDPTNYLLTCINGLVAGTHADKRVRLHYRPSASWPDSLFAFANVPLPKRSGG